MRCLFLAVLRAAKERSIVEDASCQLALEGGNKAMIRKYHLSEKACRIDLAQLHAYSLPDPIISFKDPVVLRENGFLIGNLFPKPEKMPTKRLIMGFDATYMRQLISSLSCRMGKVLVGAPYYREGCADPDRSFLVLDGTCVA